MGKEKKKEQETTTEIQRSRSKSSSRMFIAKSRSPIQHTLHWSIINLKYGYRGLR